MASSIAYAEKVNNHQTAVFDARTRTVANAFQSGQASTVLSPPSAMTSQPPTLGAPVSQPPDTSKPGSLGGPYYYNLDKFWRTEVMSAAISKSDAQNMTPLAHEFSNVLTQQYIRDLATEPSIHSMLPTYREVQLACAPPPEQAAIATAASVAASVEAKGAKGALDARLAESVVKLFEQTERTIFLQYALFRLCEMSINSAGEFRNVFPLIIHEVVRQSASLPLEADIETAKAKKATAEADAVRFQVEAKRLDCVKAQQELDKSATAEKMTAVCGPAPKAAAATSVGESPASPAAPAQPRAPTEPGKPK
jgi:hypothetical protein